MLVLNTDTLILIEDIMHGIVNSVIFSIYRLSFHDLSRVRISYYTTNFLSYTIKAVNIYNTHLLISEIYDKNPNNVKYYL